MAAKGMADRKMTASFLEEVKEEAGRATEQLLLQAKTEPGDILIVGCSSSEIVGERIGTFSSVETAQAVFEGIYEIKMCIRDRDIMHGHICMENGIDVFKEEIIILEIK